MGYVLEASKVDSLGHSQSLTISFFLLGVNWREPLVGLQRHANSPTWLNYGASLGYIVFFAYLSVLATWSSADTVAQNGYQIF